MPMGWSVEDGEPVSPWTALDDWSWPGPETRVGDVRCSKTPRPALEAGPEVQLVVEQILPDQVTRIEFLPKELPEAFRAGFERVNPYGDGKFRVVVANIGERSVTVPALLTDGTDISWTDSLIVLCELGHPEGDWRPSLLPGAGSVTSPQGVTLKPSESVDTAIDVMELADIAWPTTMSGPV